MARNDSAATDATTGPNLRAGAVQVPRSRGALSGVLLVLLGAWGALIPFIGPSFNFSFTPDTSWHWTAARFWLEVLPGVAAALGGLLSFMSTNRAVIGVGAWISVAAGVWFIIGRDVAVWLKIGSPGTPAGTSTSVRAFETLALFSGLGAVILFFAAFALGRTSVHSVRDVRAAERRAAKKQKKESKLRGSAYEDGHRDGLAEGRAAQDAGNQPATGAQAQTYPPPSPPAGQYGPPPQAPADPNGAPAVERTPGA